MLLSFARSTASLTVLLASLALLLVAPRADAAYGDLDPTFAGIGYTSGLPASNAYGSLLDAALQPDGKFVVAGEGGVDFFNSKSMIQRLLPDGSPDPSFGSGGSVLLATPSALDDSEVRSIALQGDGKIVVVAEKSGATLLFRLTTTGAIDTSFASPLGYLSIPDEYPHSVVVANSGAVLTGARGPASSVVVRRYSSTGVQVAAFASNVAAGLAGTTFYSNDAVVLRTYGSDLFVVATSEVAGNPRFFAAKFLATGSIDSSWGTSGKSTVTFSIGAVARTALVQASGAVILGGSTEVMGDSAWTYARLTAGGTLDPTFAGGGKVELNSSSGGDAISGLANLPDGGFVVGGSIEDAVSGADSAAFRVLNVDGVPDTRFGPDGLHLITLSGTSVDSNQVLAQPDGRIVLSGSSKPPVGGERTPLTMRLQQYVAPAPPPPVLGAKVTSPKGKKIAAKKLTKIAGTASTTGVPVTKVYIALQRIDKKLLKKSTRCLWLSSSKVKFKRLKAVKSKCSTPKWLKATGTAKWSFSLKKKKRLPKGSYVLQVRVDAGSTTTVFSSARKFSVK